MRKTKRPSYYLLTLGCPKNLVDSEGMSELLTAGGYRPIDDPAHAENTIRKWHKWFLAKEDVP